MPITQFCHDNKLTPRERLALFVPVCQAIQHAVDVDSILEGAYEGTTEVHTLVLGEAITGLSAFR